MLSIINDMERIGDICYQISITFERKNEQKTNFTSELISNLDNLMNEVVKAFEIMNNNLNSDYSQVNILNANEAEESINNLRDTLRKSYLEKIEKGDFNIQTGMIYYNIIHSLEKIGDHIFNITEAIVGDK
jgi:phosphate:Na+ symporter